MSYGNQYRPRWAEDYRRQYEAEQAERQREADERKQVNDRARAERLQRKADQDAAKRRQSEAAEAAALAPTKERERHAWLIDHPDGTEQDFEKVWPHIKELRYGRDALVEQTKAQLRASGQYQGI